MGAVRSNLVINDGMTPTLRRINKAMGLMLGNFEAVQRASGKSINTANLTAARQEINRANAELDNMERNYRSINNQQNNLNRSLNVGAINAGGLLSKIKGMASAYLGMKGLSAVKDLSDTLTSNRARLSLIVDDGGSVADLEKKIYKSAQRTRANYLDTMNTVAKLGLVAGKAFSGNDQIIKFSELVNKNFVVGGASATEQASAMYQLTQAMGSGRLQGDEYRSIIENAPLLAKSIEDYMRNVQGATGTMKEWASEGKLTADVIKAAVFKSADEVEERFNKMPKTWSQIWTSMKNRAIMALDPLLKKINELANSERVQRTVDSLMNAFSFVAVLLARVFDGACAVYDVIANNWGWIAPIIMGVAAAVAAYNTALFINNTVQAISTGLKTLAAVAAVAHGTATAAEAAATTGMTAAQVAFNAALLASPITWILIVIIAVIAAIYAVVAAINKVTGSTISATGVIFGVICALAAAIWNTILGLINGILQLIWLFVEPFLGVIEFTLNAANGGFDSFGDAVKNLIGNIISWFLSLGKVVTQIIDAIFGTNWTGGLNALQNTVLSWGKNDSAITISREAPTVQSITGGVDRWAYKDAWNTGYKAGEWVDDKVGSFLDFGSFAGNGTDPIGYGDLLGDIASNTEKSSEELSYLRDIAEKEAINRFTTAEIKVDMTGMTNRIDSNMDIDGVIGYLTEGVADALATAGEGVY